MDGKMVCAVCGKIVVGGRGKRDKVCQACKIFYRRAAPKKSYHVCLLGGKCSTLAMRNGGIKCKPCRFRKCRELGVSAREDGNSDTDVPINVKVYMQTADTYHNVSDHDENNEYPFPQPVHKVNVWQECHNDELQDISGFSTGSLSFLVENSDLTIHNLDGKENISGTVSSLNSLIVHIFGQQLHRWTLKMNGAKSQSKNTAANAGNINVDQMAHAVNETTGQVISDMVRFLNYLPGVSEVEGAGIRCITAGWKWLAFPLIHHAEFMTDDEAFYTVGPAEYQFSRHWFEQLADKTLVRFIYKFCSEFRKLQLTQTERFLLLVVVLLEPDCGLFTENLSDSVNCWKPCPRLTFLHTHYTGTLLRVILQRCSTEVEFSTACHKLERFFSLLKMVAAVHCRSYGFQCPRFSVEPKARVRRMQINCEISERLAV